ncbi:hypothetical protein E4T56_gene3846 [Termitomyces sp. T112]|nr:hypothetical protein E4T56_gene3846 [Termitomyces sp. T112]
MHLPCTAELYETDSRWLFNEAQQQEIRHVQFNVSELIRVACAAVGGDPCLQMHKIAEGSFNKIFRLRFQNSQSLIARIPSARMFGSGVSWAIASEVATMTFVGNKLNVRTPRVIAWNKDSDISQNPVGWPYILMEDVEGVSLNNEWTKPEMRGEPVAELLTEVANDIARMNAVSFSQLGSLYFPADLPSSIPPLAAPRLFEDQVRVGPIADPLWWRSYHDEPHLDRGPWDTVEDYINAAVRIERRAVERHREDPSSLSYTNSSVNDLVQIDHLLDKVVALAPHLKQVIEQASPLPDSFMMNVLLHPDIRAQNLMVPKLTAENDVSRMKDPCFIDWQGTPVLPHALQWCIPHVAEYQPRLFQADGRPVLNVNGFEEVPWPAGFDQLNPSQQEVLRAEHRIATRKVRWNEVFLKVPKYAYLIVWPLQRYLHLLTQGILRATADGPHTLMHLLVRIKILWDEDSNELGPCPYTFGSDELHRYQEEQERLERFDDALSRLSIQLRCTSDGCVDPEDYEFSMHELARARLEWDEVSCGGPFPFEDGRWGQFLR